MPELIELPVEENTATADPRRGLLDRVFAVLNASGTPWCIAHGYEQFAADVPVDIDCILGRELSPDRLAKLLSDNEDQLNARVVQWLNDGAQWIVLATKETVPTILQLHVSYDYVLSEAIIYRGDEILESRTQLGDFWIASPAIEFGCILSNRIVKGKLDQRRQQILNALYEQDSAGCTKQIARLFSAECARIISMCARTQRWADVIAEADVLKEDLLASKEYTSVFGGWSRRIKRWLKPDCGFHIVFLGPDGVGKSTVIEAVRGHLSDAFLRTDYFTFAPSLIPQKLQVEKKTPHALPPRSYPASLLKAAWWAVCYTLGYQLSIRPAKARASFVMNHRYLLDAMVDRKRYRYSGPAWMLKAIWAVAPKPDLIVLLDADPKIIWARKKEVALEETIRQRDGYRALVEPLKFGRLVEASQPIEKVVNDVDQLVLDRLYARVAKRFGLKEKA